MYRKPNRVLRSFFFALTIFFSGSACREDVKAPDDPLKHVLGSNKPKIRKVMDRADQYEIQIRYTQIDRKNDGVVFTDYDFQVDESKYFYPASTVKFPIAVLTLEKLNELDTLNIDTRFYIEGDTLETSFADEISKIFAISDNDANNRLFEFLGQDEINERLKRRGVEHVRIAHRLGIRGDDITTRPLIIYLNDSTIAPWESSINTPPKPLDMDMIKKGIGFYDEDSLVMAPFDFSLKNYYAIDAQHAVLKRVIFPEKFKTDERFNLSRRQREFLLTAMHSLPRNLGYDVGTYYDGYGKFFMFGDTKDAIPDHIKIYNKVGFAYGTLTDCAYIFDTRNHIDFLLTATILVNKNGIFNDNVYEFEEVGLPFLAELGRELYKYERHRKNRNHEQFKF